MTASLATQQDFFVDADSELNGTQLEAVLSKDFLDRYDDFPSHMNDLGRFVYLRTYARFLDQLGRRENLKETVSRAVTYNINLELRHRKKLGLPIDMAAIYKEAELLFDNIFNLRQFLSGRTLWIGGASNGVAEKFPLANFNCSALSIRDWEDMADLFYMLLVGTGVGFKSTKKFAREMPKIRTNVTLVHKDYEPVEPHKRFDDTVLLLNKETGVAKILIGDSKEGWVQSLRYFFDILTKEEYEHIHTIHFNYDYIRPKGERLRTFGGTASGPEPVREMFEGFDKTLKNQIDPTLDPIEVDEKGYGHVRPIHILDMGNFIGNNVVVGGVRRTAEIFLFDSDDEECLWAKFGVNGYWCEEDFERLEAVIEYCKKEGIPYPKRIEQYRQKYYDETVNVDHVTGQPRREKDGSLSPYNFGSGLYHRSLSNNSIAFTSKPDRSRLRFIFQVLKGEGEPGFINLEEAARRRLKGAGITNPSRELVEQVMLPLALNPCAEILLDSYGVCNLTTVNVMQFVINGEFDWDGFEEAQRLSARSSLRMTLVDLEIPHWDAVQKRDRLLGTSLTGVKDAMAALGWGFEEEKAFLKRAAQFARDEANRYAKELRIPTPLLVTTIKPEGTLSQVAGGVSSGLHWSHSPYYIRRVRISADDPLAKAVQALGWRVSPENGTPGKTDEERMKNARTLVVSFPMKSPSKVTKNDVNVKDQFDTYFAFQEIYTEHNSSNTIHVRPDEWDEVEQIVWDNWDDFVGVSFLSYDGGTYQQAPYETITKEQYEQLATETLELTPEFLKQFEGQESDLDIGSDGCEAGVCPIR